MKIKLTYYNKRKFLPILIFVFFLSINLSLSGGHVDPVDGGVYLLVAENIVRNGSFSLTINTNTDEELGIDVRRIIELQSWGSAFSQASRDIARGAEKTLEQDQITERREYIDELLKDLDYENYAGPTYLVLPILAAPLYAIAVSANLSAINFVPLILNSVIIAVTATIIFLLGKDIFSEKIGFVLALIFGVSSFSWPYINSLFANPLAVMFMILSIYFIIHEKNHGVKFAFLGGLAIGLTVIAHPIFQIQAIGIFVFGIFHFRKNKKLLGLFLLGLLIMVGIQGYANEVRFDSITDFGTMQDYQGRLDRNADVISAEGIFGMIDSFSMFLFSPGYSIFVYLPIVVLTPIGWYYMFKKYPSLTLLMIFLSSIMIIFLLTGASDWNANPHWGTHRYLLGIIPAMIIPIGSLISEFSNLRFKVLVAVLGTIGFITNLFGNLVWVQYAYAYGWGPEGLWKLKDIPAIFTWNAYHSPIMQSFKVLTTNWVATLDPNPSNIDFFKIGLNGCNVDMYLYCEFGLISNIILAAIITLIGFYIVKILIVKEDEIKCI